MLTMETAQKLLHETTAQPHLLTHALAVSAAMGAMARRFGGDEEYWRAVGFLHDYDYEKYPDEHLDHTEKELSAAGVDDTAIRAILAHGYGLRNDVCPESSLEKSLYAVDELTGLIFAASLMRPNGIFDLEAKSVVKKMKDLKFAAKINRDVIRKGAEMLQMELSDLISVCIEGMRGYAMELGLGTRAYI